MALPDTHYARCTDRARVAYKVIGGGKLDTVFVSGFVSNLEHHCEDSGFSHLLSRLGGFPRFRRASETPFNPILEARP
jgi:hypothetical protein